MRAMDNQIGNPGNFEINAARQQKSSMCGGAIKRVRTSGIHVAAPCVRVVAAGSQSA
jgi:hypothetical protein